MQNVDAKLYLTVRTIKYKAIYMSKVAEIEEHDEIHESNSYFKGYYLTD